MRLSREHFDWTEGKVPAAPPEIRYIVHMLKNETAKLTWCSQSIRELNLTDTSDELDIIDRSICHIQEFVRRSSWYSRDIVLDFNYIHMPELLQESANEMTADWKGTVTIRADGGNLDLNCDCFHLKEVLCNLIKNALDAMDQNGTLTLSCESPRKNIVLIKVEDTGCGMPEEVLPHIFDLFYTGHSDYMHMGVGLSYCRNVVRAHGGYFRIESRCDEKNHGTTFTICLPRNSTKLRRKADGTGNTGDGRRG